MKTRSENTNTFLRNTKLTNFKEFHIDKIIKDIINTFTLLYF